MRLLAFFSIFGVFAFAEVVTIPRLSYDRAVIEVRLMDALRKDIMDEHMGICNVALRREIQRLVGELSRNP